MAFFFADKEKFSLSILLRLRLLDSVSILHLTLPPPLDGVRGLDPLLLVAELALCTRRSSIHRHRTDSNTDMLREI